jgi:hypothetical protein
MSGAGSPATAESSTGGSPIFDQLTQPSTPPDAPPATTGAGTGDDAVDGAGDRPDAARPPAAGQGTDDATADRR